MPQVMKQTNRISNDKPKIKTGASPSAWDFASHIKAIVYGQSGTGKTTFWGSFPGRVKALICSGGRRPGELRSIDTPENRKRVDAVTIHTTDDLKRELDTLSSYDLTVLDHISGLQNLDLKEVLGLTEIPAVKNWGIATRQQYGETVTHVIEYLTVLLGQSTNLIVIAQERTFGGSEDNMDPEVIKAVIGPDVMPSLCRWMAPAFDYILQTYKRGRTITKTVRVGKHESRITERVKGVDYCLRCEPHEIYMTKFRLLKGHKLPESITDPDYNKLMSVIAGKG